MTNAQQEKDDNSIETLILGCYSHPNDMDRGYPEFGYYLNQTGRPMIYACSWPVYQTYSGMTVGIYINSVLLKSILNHFFS